MSDPQATSAEQTSAHDREGVLGEIDSPAGLFAVYASIIVLFFVTLGMSLAGALGKYTIFAQLAIAATQATIVAYYFMHLKQGDRIVILTALASIFWTFILFVLFMADYATRQRVVGWW